VLIWVIWDGMPRVWVIISFPSRLLLVSAFLFGLRMNHQLTTIVLSHFGNSIWNITHFRYPRERFWTSYRTVGGRIPLNFVTMSKVLYLFDPMSIRSAQPSGWISGPMGALTIRGEKSPFWSTMRAGCWLCRRRPLWVVWSPTGVDRWWKLSTLGLGTICN
jgi:hypothetical protein